MALTKTQARNARDKLYALNIELACKRVLEQIKEAKDAGLRINCAMYPTINSGLTAEVTVFREFKRTAIKVIDITLRDTAPRIE